MIHSQPFMFDVAKIDPIAIRIEMMMNKRGLGIVVPDIIMPQFDIEPLTLFDIYYHPEVIYPKANISKLRSIIRKAKQNETRS